MGLTSVTVVAVSAAKTGWAIIIPKDSTKHDATRFVLFICIRPLRKFLCPQKTDQSVNFSNIILSQNHYLRNIAHEV